MNDKTATLKELNQWKQKLKAYFASSLFNDADTYGPDYSEYTGGDLEAFSLEAINKVIDSFDPSKIGE